MRGQYSSLKGQPVTKEVSQKLVKCLAMKPTVGFPTLPVTLPDFSLWQVKRALRGEVRRRSRSNVSGWGSCNSLSRGTEGSDCHLPVSDNSSRGLSQPSHCAHRDIAGRRAGKRKSRCRGQCLSRSNSRSGRSSRGSLSRRGGRSD